MWVLSYGSTIVAAFLPFYYAAGRGWCKGAKCRIAVADALFGLIYYPLLVFLAGDACARLKGSIVTRWLGATVSSEILGKLLASRMVVHLIVVFARNTETSQRTLFVVHHAMVIVVYAAGVGRERAHFWGALAALCEVTNVFLTIEELIALVWRTSDSIFRNINRAVFALSYVFMRLLLFPVSLVGFLYDVLKMSDAQSAQLGNFELTVYPIAYILVFLLSATWARDVFADAPRVLNRLAQPFRRRRKPRCRP
ncbi:hypothetical protein CTAYLR_001768 [Chrysophaeum taylorii]|uniref:TLC domain-containing protein n=1 Tax=Chrysophaeum taylorii TaxID=2483200 RepID=A0AAD7XMI0_9STRA|nr:hypothetical protein CTAYLR_001768 [Chrysophaeum taylorii]